MAHGEARESVKMALATLRENRLRSGLTILGIVIGITTVIVISAVINGINLRVQAWLDSMGSNVLWVSREPLIQVNLSSEQRTRRKLTVEDAQALETLAHVVATESVAQTFKSFELGAVSAKFNGRKVSSSILEGDTARVSEVVAVTLLEGRFFTEDEDLRRAHVCVLGHDTWEALFRDEPAVGKQINVETGLYTVIGVLDKLKQPIGNGKNPNDNDIMFPMGTFHNLHPESNDVTIIVKYDDPRNKSLVEEEVRETLRVRRRVPVRSNDNFEITSPEAITRLWNQLTGGLVLFMIAVSCVGLMVGGVGVMNIMLVSVTERTREIGVRKAVGATRRTILTQFTTEAVALCAVGGIFGILVGAALTYLIYFLPIGVPATLSTTWMLIGFSVSCVIGLVFGIYPAWKAASLDPIEALRYE